MAKYTDTLEYAKKIVLEFAEHHDLDYTFNKTQTTSSSKEADPNSIKTRRGEFYPYVRDGYVHCGIRRKSQACCAHITTNNPGLVKKQLIKYLRSFA